MTNSFRSKTQNPTFQWARKRFYEEVPLVKLCDGLYDKALAVWLDTYEDREPEIVGASFIFPSKQLENLYFPKQAFNSNVGRILRIIVDKAKNPAYDTLVIKTERNEDGDILILGEIEDQV